MCNQSLAQQDFFIYVQESETALAHTTSEGKELLIQEEGGEWVRVQLPTSLVVYARLSEDQ